MPPCLRGFLRPDISEPHAAFLRSRHTFSDVKLAPRSLMAASRLSRSRVERARRSSRYSRRPMETVIRPSRARCVNGRTPRHECAVLSARHPARAGQHAGHRPQRVAAQACFTPESGPQHLITACPMSANRVPNASHKSTAIRSPRRRGRSASVEARGRALWRCAG